MTGAHAARHPHWWLRLPWVNAPRVREAGARIAEHEAELARLDAQQPHVDALTEFARETIRANHLTELILAIPARRHR